MGVAFSGDNNHLRHLGLGSTNYDIICHSTKGEVSFIIIVIIIINLWHVEGQIIIYIISWKSHEIIINLCAYGVGLKVNNISFKHLKMSLGPVNSSPHIGRQDVF